MSEIPGSISVVIPMLDAQAHIRTLYDALTTTLENHNRPAEIILVDDGSTDETWASIAHLAAADPAVTGLRLARNAGQTGALCAGFSVATGHVVVMMDDDSETDPAGLVPLVEAVESGADFASGWRKGRRPFIRMLGSRLYNARLRRWGLPFHDAGCGFNAMTGPMAKRLKDEGWRVRQHHFKPRVAQLTDRIVEVPLPVRLTRGSHHSTTRLAASWLDVELTFGSLTIPGFVLGGIIAPVAVAALAARVSTRDRLHPRSRFVALGWVVAAGIAAGWSTRLLELTTRQEQSTHAQPAWEIAEIANIAGGGCRYHGRAERRRMNS